MLAPNTILQNRYRVLRELKRGGMGTVYEALDQRLRCRVALKETFATDDAYTRKAFEREAALLANLRHRALPKVIDYFADVGSDFLVMEFIPGNDLAELLESNDRPFSESQVVRWALAVLDVLEYLHLQKPPILHRDIKPSNLKLTKEGDLFLLDFGIAKGSLGPMSTLATNRSVRAFTPVYASLEQIVGKGTDPRSDIYSLGATLYQLLTGVAPMDAPTRYQEIEDEYGDPLPAIRDLRPDISQKVADIVHQAMTINRKKRMAGALEMRQAMLAAITGNDKTRNGQGGAYVKEFEAEPLFVPTTEGKPLPLDLNQEFTILHSATSEKSSLDQPSQGLKAHESSKENHAVDEYEWFCSNCQGIIDEADEQCPFCGSDTTEVVEKPGKQVGRFEAPVKRFTTDQLIQAIPKIGYYFRGLERFNKRDLEGAIDDYTKAIELDPAYADAYLNRGLARNSKGQHDAAITDYNKAIELAPDYADAYVNRSLARSSKGDAKGALADCNRAIEIQPQHDRAYGTRGMALYDIGDLKGAIADCDKAIEINPSFAPAYASRGAAKLRLGKDAEAQRDFESAIKIDDNMRLDLEQWIRDIKQTRKLGMGQRISNFLKGSTI